MNIPHPIPYQGSKRHLAQTIIGYFPDDITRLIEPFAGSAAVSLAAAASGFIRQFVLNDINAPLINLWHELIRHPDNLADYYDKLWQAQQGRERRFYDAVRTRFNKTQRPYYFLYLMARCVKASVRYNAKGEFNQSPDNRRKGRQPKAMRSDLQQASALLKDKTTLMSLDYRKALEIATPQDVVYLDPPYQGVCANRDPRYIEGVNYDEFVETLTLLNSRNISYIISYDGRTGDKSFGKPLPESLNLTRIELKAGRSSQATLLGRDDYTYESLYLSSALLERTRAKSIALTTEFPQQLSLFGETA
jgi:DNA adenine methylase